MRPSDLFRRALALAGGAAVLLSAPVVAQAASGDDHTPGGPAAKEYAIPLDSTRRDAGGGSAEGGGGGGTGSVSSHAAPAPLFGVGVTARSAKSSGDSGSKAAGAKSVDRGTGVATAAPPPARTALATDSGSSTVGLTLGIVGGIVLFGLAGGLLMRRFGRP
jgi:hypothetical protein